MNTGCCDERSECDCEELLCKITALENKVTALYERTDDLAEELIPTGEIAYSFATEREGWMLLNGNTIGNEGSGSNRSDIITKNLFIFLWTNLSDAVSPMKTSGGASSTRGSSALADWNALKRLTLPDFQGRVLAMKDSDAAILTSWTNSNAAVSILGATGGLAVHTLIEGEIPGHVHSIAVPSGGKLIVSPATAGSVPDDSLSGFEFEDPSEVTESAGGDGEHNNVQPTGLVNIFVKL